MALQTRVIDGTITGADNVVGRKLYEVCTYGLQLPIFSGMWVLAMNKETWNNIPKELQMLIEEVSKEIYAAERKGIAEMENTSWETLRKLGLQVYTIPSEEKERWRKATDGVAERYVKEWNAKGYPVKEAFEMMRKIARK
jgi:TRAP-type C4-dicarboxylate transport system substrate-binding protein